MMSRTKAKSRQSNNVGFTVSTVGKFLHTHTSLFTLYRGKQDASSKAHPAKQKYLRRVQNRAGDRCGLGWFVAWQSPKRCLEKCICSRGCVSPSLVYHVLAVILTDPPNAML